MATWLKQSTAREIAMGPFVDQTDGFTAETGLTIAQADVRLKKNEGDWGQKNETTTLVHEENGWYRCLLNATDTDTLGILMVAVNESGALPVWREFLVVPANVWDSFLGADLLDVSVTQWLGTAAATPTVAGIPEVDVTHWLGTAAATPTVAGVPEVDLTHLGGVAQSATDLKDFADDGYDPATNKVQGVVLADTVTTYTGNTPQTGDAFARIGAPAGVSVSADIAAIEAQTDDIGVAGAGLIALGDARLANLDAAVTTRAVAGDAMALTVAERAATADKLLGRTRAGGADGGRTVAQCLAFGRNKWEIAGGVLTVYADDDLTPLYTAAVTTAAGDPVTSVDPV